jgi:hypothetical protein
MAISIAAHTLVIEVYFMSIHEDQAPKLSVRLWRHRSKAALHALENHSLSEIDEGKLDRELDRAETNSGESMRSVAHRERLHRDRNET